jgi:type I restriction enzyme S subunit
MSKIDELIAEFCPDGVPRFSIGELCKVETGKRDANEGSDDGQYHFFTTAKKTGRIDTYRWDCDALLIAGNANIGNVKQYNGKFDAYQRTYVLSGFRPDVDVRYLYFALSDTLNFYLDANKNVAAMTYIVLKTLVDFEVPVPSLEVQREIVSILDKFTQLEAELEAELEARRSQYEHTRGQLLDFSGDLSSHPLRELIAEFCPEGVKSLSIAEIAEVGTGSSDKKDTAISGLFPLYVRSKNVEKSDTFEFDETAIIIPGEGGVGDIFHFATGKYALHQRAYRISPVDSRVDPKYLFYAFKVLFKDHISSKAVSATVTSIRKPMVTSFSVPIPPLQVQREIVSILDKLDALVNDLTFGLPAEIVARRKQYEYYRNKLLTFKELETA